MGEVYNFRDYKSETAGDENSEDLRKELVAIYHSLSNIVREDRVICVNVSRQFYKEKAEEFLKSKGVQQGSIDFLIEDASDRIFGKPVELEPIYLGSSGTGNLFRIL